MATQYKEVQEPWEQAEPGRKEVTQSIGMIEWESFPRVEQILHQKVEGGRKNVLKMKRLDLFIITERDRCEGEASRDVFNIDSGEARFVLS